MSVVASHRAIPAPTLVAPLGLVTVALTVAVLGFAAVREVPLLLDEKPHYERIRAFRDGDEMRVHPAVCPHTYHWTLAGLSALLGIESEEGTRLLSLLVSLGCVPAAFRIVRYLGPTDASLRVAQLLFLPVLIPFLFLLYSDSLGLLFVLLALGLALDGCVWGAALASIIGMMVRQTHVCWMIFAFALPYVREYGWRLEREAVLGHLRRGWLFLLGFAGFALFVLVNGGVALGDRQQHPSFRFHSDSVLFSLFLVFVVCLPLHVANLPAIGRLVRARPWWLLVVAGLFSLLWFGARFDHPYNQWSHCLRNKVLNCVAGSDWSRALFFLAVALATLSLAVTRLRESSASLLYPLAVLSVALSWLIDPRYAMPGLALFILLRESRSRTVEWMSLAWSVLLSVVVLDGTFRQAFFL